MVSCFLCYRCFGSLLFTTCVLLGSFVIYINLLFIDQKKKKENIQRDLLWGRGALERRTHNVKWETVRSKRGKGGLGV